MSNVITFDPHRDGAEEILTAYRDLGEQIEQGNVLGLAIIYLSAGEEAEPMYGNLTIAQANLMLDQAKRGLLEYLDD